MNILLITNLYPAYPGQSIKETTYALHDFSTEWVKTNRVIVIRFIYPISYKKIFVNKTIYPNIRSNFSLDDIQVYNIKEIKLPRTDIVILNRKKIIKLLHAINFVPDVILGHRSGGFIAAKKIAHFYKCKYILGIHYSDLIELKHRKYNKALPECAQIACRSQSIKNKLIELFPKYENKMFIANSGIDFNDIEQHDFFIKKIERWKNKEKIIFLIAAVLQNLKNIDITLKSLLEITDCDWEFWIIGDGEEKTNLLNLTTELQLGDKVHFLGEKTRTEVLEYLKASDVFIMVSAPETFGLAYLEAMAKGNIIIGCKGWGIDGIIIDKENGFLVEGKNIHGLTQTIQTLISLPFEEKTRLIMETERTILSNTKEKSAKKYLDKIS